MRWMAHIDRNPGDGDEKFAISNIDNCILILYNENRLNITYISHVP